ncbi:Os03g0210350, partial [Oryza sativa Japonica Group]
LLQLRLQVSDLHRLRHQLTLQVLDHLHLPVDHLPVLVRAQELERDLLEEHRPLLLRPDRGDSRRKNGLVDLQHVIQRVPDALLLQDHPRLHQLDLSQQKRVRAPDGVELASDDGQFV